MASKSKTIHCIPGTKRTEKGLNSGGRRRRRRGRVGRWRSSRCSQLTLQSSSSELSRHAPQLRAEALNFP
eukprot:2489926-Rhodomonas_salina.1